MFLRNTGLSPSYRALQHRRLYGLKMFVHYILNYKLGVRGVVLGLESR
jgi:hypothetical protein